MQSLKDKLIEAAEKGSLEEFKQLIAQQVNVNHLFRLIASNGILNAYKYLLNNGADIHARDDEALRSARGNDILDVFKHFLRLYKEE